MIAATLARVRQVACVFEIGDDALHGALGDPNSGCDFTQASPRFVCDANQYVGVVTKERPVKIGRLPSQFMYHTLTPGRDGDINYANCSSYFINLS
jgi:hypothetical protein